MSASKTSSKSPNAGNSWCKSNPTFITKRHDILDGEAIVLRTKHLQTAFVRAKNKWADITALVKAGKKVSKMFTKKWKARKITI